MSDLNFKPESEGLGFHPFSNGLPYSPVPTSTPSVATRVVVTPQPAIPLAPEPPRLWGDSRVSQEVARAALAKENAEVVMRPWYRTRRVAAFVVDWMVSALAVAAILGSGIWLAELPLSPLGNPDVAFSLVAFFLLFQWFWILTQEISTRTTFGKNLFGLRLVGSTGSVILRAILFVPSIGLGGVGVLFSLLDRRARCWHDGVAGLSVSESSREKKD